jgi:predicted PurR-regulated permease PerM
VRPRTYRLLFWLAAIAIVVFALSQLSAILLPFAVGFVIAYVLAPAVARLERWGIWRGAASLLVLITFLFVVGFIFFLLVPLIQGQIVVLVAHLPDLTNWLQDQFGNLITILERHLPAQEMDKLRDLVGSKLGEAVSWFASGFQRLVTSSIAILNILSLVIVTPIVSFFLLRDWDRIVALIDTYLPRGSVGTIREQARAVSDTLAGFVHGQVLVCVILACYYATALTLAQIRPGAAVGLLIGVLAIIPLIGATIGFALSLGLAALQHGTWTSILIVCGIFLFGQSVEANILTPKLIGDRIHLHPVWVIFALFAGGTLFGFIGVLIAVPAAAVIGVLVRFALLRYRRSAVYDPRQPEPVRGFTPLE